MVEAHAPEPTPKRKSFLPKLLGLGAVMLVIAAVVNLNDLRAIASGRKTFKSVLYGKNLALMRPTFAFPEPLGPEGAKVKAQVFCQEGNGCHEPLVLLWMAVGQLEPKRVRVEFNSPATMLAQGKQPVEMACEAQVLINGDRKFEVGEGKSKHTFYLTGPMPGPPHGMAPDSPGAAASGHGWNLGDVAAVVNQYIKKQYKQDGHLTPEAIKAGITEAEKRIPHPDDTTDKSGKGGEPKATST
jgi:hypothetical protein